MSTGVMRRPGITFFPRGLPALVAVGPQCFLTSSKTLVLKTSFAPLLLVPTSWSACGSLFFRTCSLSVLYLVEVSSSELALCLCYTGCSETTFSDLGDECSLLISAENWFFGIKPQTLDSFRQFSWMFFHGILEDWKIWQQTWDDDVTNKLRQYNSNR